MIIFAFGIPINYDLQQGESLAKGSKGRQSKKLKVEEVEEQYIHKHVVDISTLHIHIHVSHTYL